MSEDEFINAIDGAVNDFENGLSDGTELRAAICDTVLKLCKSFPITWSTHSKQANEVSDKTTNHKPNSNEVSDQT